MKKILFITILVTIFGVFPKVSFAQEVSLSISPTTRQAIIKPAQSFTVPYSIINHGDPQLVILKIVGFEAQPDGTVNFLNEADKGWQFTIDNEDVKLGKSFFLKSNQVEHLSLSVVSPQVLQEKDYYFSLLVQTQASPTNEGNITARAELTVGSNLLISVTSDGSLDTKPKVVEFRMETNSSVVQTGQKVPVILKVANQGRHLIIADGKLTINGLGPKKNLELTSQPILINSQSILYNNPLGFFFGPYTISTNLTFGPNSPVLYASTQIFVIPPIKYLALFLILSIIASGVILYVFKK